MVEWIRSEGLVDYDLAVRTMEDRAAAIAAAGAITVDASFLLDPLSAVMLAFVTFVGFLIHVYSIGYMHDESDDGYARYFAYLNLFMFAMLLLVLALAGRDEGSVDCALVLLDEGDDRARIEARRAELVSLMSEVPPESPGLTVPA